MRAVARRTSLLALAACLLTSPVAAGGLPPIPPNTDGALYEVMESMTLHGAGSSKTRRATATLVGSMRAGTPICPTSLNVPRCAVNVTASYTVRVATGLGYITGDFQVVGPGDNDEDGAEQVLMSGTIAADINLAPAYLHMIPIANLTNGFLKGTGAKGTALDRVNVRAQFTGTFRLPFRPTPTSPESYLIITPDGFEVVPVMPDERSLGLATVRLEIEFQ